MAFSLIGDLANKQGGGQSIAPQVSAAQAADALAGAAVDLENCDDMISLLVEVGATSGTPTSFSVDAKLQEAIEDPANPGAPLSSDWSDVANGAIAQVVAADKEAIVSCRKRTKRFVRAAATVAFVGGSSPTVGISGTIVADKKVTGSGNGAQL